MDNLSEKFKLHDKYRLEMKFTYPLDRKLKENTYHVDTYIFFPGSLGLSPSSYPKEAFYADLQEYIRLKTPAVLLRVMTGGEKSPLRKLEHSMRHLADQEQREKSASDAYQTRLKMFCSIMKSALRDEETFLERSSASLNFQLLIEKYLTLTEDILEHFRTLKLILETPSVDPSELELFRLVDEFLSITANKYRYKLWIFLNTHPEEVWTEKIKARIVKVLRDEISYREAERFPSVPHTDSDNEELIYRESALKKVMASVLFLKTTVRKDGVLVENLFFGIAAGIAMAFATIITLVTQKWFYSELSIVFFAIVIAAYIGKDRIKDLLRAYFQKRIRNYLYDFKTIIRSGLGKEVGVCQESFTFVDEKKVNPNILKVRHRDYMGDLVHAGFGESVILARKHVTITTENCRNLFVDFNVDGVVDIMRFNVRQFLWRMDNPVRDIFLPDEKGNVVRIKGRRVYHINIIIKYGMEGREDSYARYRIVLSRNGIKRIETFPIMVSSNGAL